mgnify:CR=1 FL=1
MAPQDYVSRSNSKKKSPYKQQPEAQSLSLKFKVVALITLLGIGGGAFGLWQLTQIKPLETTTTVEQAIPSKHSALPKPPEEKWDYIDQLKEDKDLEVGQYEVVKKGPYKMQCGSFKTRAQADTLKAKIAFSGLVAQVSQSKGSNGTWYKVYLGPYPKKRSAEKDKHKLKNNNINHCQIWLWR